MKRLITIDNGNTNCTVGVFEENQLKEVMAFSDYQKKDDDFILISNVGKTLEIKPSYDLKEHRTLTHFFDMPVRYSMTLGDDRMISAYGVYKNLEDNDLCLLIDAGTFITCDLISKEGFLGGYIFPGIERFLSSYANSENLTQYSVTDFKINLDNQDDKTDYPESTKEAILRATTIYLKNTIEGIIQAASPSKLILTGGSAKDIQNIINSEVPSELNHHLVHLALDLLHQQYILQAEA